MKIVNIAGHGRSGSTLLATILGKLPNARNIGEGRYLIDRKLHKDNRPCSCGKQISECSYWRKYADSIGVKDIDFATRQLRTRKIPELLMSSLTNSLIPAEREHLITTLATIFQSIVEDEDSVSVIIDSSKHPSYGLLLGQMARNYADIDLYLVHLIRDARGVVSSWMKPKGYLPARSPWHVCSTWLVNNFFAESQRLVNTHYLLIRYEDFVSSPSRSLQSILDYIGEDISDPSQLLTSDLQVQNQHTLAGNPDKLKWSGKIEIKRQDWQLPPTTEVLVNFLTWPGLWRYGYRITRG